RDVLFGFFRLNADCNRVGEKAFRVNFLLSQVGKWFGRFPYFHIISKEVRRVYFAEFLHFFREILRKAHSEAPPKLLPDPSLILLREFRNTARKPFPNPPHFRQKEHKTHRVLKCFSWNTQLPVG